MKDSTSDDQTLTSEESEQRPACKYGTNCYRRDPTHIAKFWHPPKKNVELGACERPENESPSLPACPYGMKCYRRNPQHFEEFLHPPEHPQAKIAIASTNEKNQQNDRTISTKASEHSIAAKHLFNDDQSKNANQNQNIRHNIYDRKEKKTVPQATSSYGTNTSETTSTSNVSGKKRTLPPTITESLIPTKK